MKKQIVVIHGGKTYRTYKEYIYSLEKYEIDFEKIKNEGWKDTLEKKLGKGFEVIYPEMPNSSNAKYLEWKIWLEKNNSFFEK